MVLDGHFGNAGGYALARGQGLEIISKLRSDAALYEHYEGEQKEQGRPRQYGSQIDYKQLPANCVVSSGEEDGYLVERSHLRGVWQKKFGVRLNVLVLVATRLKDGRRSNVVLFSSDLELGWEKPNGIQVPFLPWWISSALNRALHLGWKYIRDSESHAGQARALEGVGNRERDFGAVALLFMFAIVRRRGHPIPNCFASLNTSSIDGSCRSHSSS